MTAHLPWLTASPARTSRQHRSWTAAAWTVTLTAGACLLAAGLAGSAASAAQPNAALPAGGAAGTQSAAASPTSTIAADIPADYHVDVEINPTGDATQDALLKAMEGARA